MAREPTSEDIIHLARLIGLDLPPEYQADLIAAYGRVRELIAAMPVNRPRGDEPAHVFDPREFLPKEG